MLDRLGYYSCMPDERDREAEEMRELARKLGSRGGKIGGKARAEKLTSEQRKEIARKAAKARWDKKKREEGS